MAYRNGNIPDNCDKIMFAEDVVTWFMYDYYASEFRPLIGSRYREFIYEAFNSTVKDAMICLYEQVNMDLFDDDDPPDRYHYIRFCRNLRRLFFRDGFDAKLFLMYSVYVMSTLGEMINTLGVQEAGDLAVRCILKAFEKRDMLCGGWDTLNATAQKIASIEDYADSHTPKERVSPERENVNPPSSSSDEQDSGDENLDGNVSNNLGELKTQLEVNQQVSAERHELRKPSGSITKQAFPTTAKSDDIEGNVEQMKSPKRVKKLGSPSPSSCVESIATPVKDLLTSEYENKDEKDSSPETDNRKLEVIKTESPNSVDASEFPLSQMENNWDLQDVDIADPVLTSELENNRPHLKRQQSQEQDYNKSVKKPGLGSISPQNSKIKMVLENISVFYDQSSDSTNNPEQIRTQTLPTEDKTRLSQGQNPNGFVEVPGLGSLLTQHEEEMVLKQTSTCDAQNLDFTGNLGQPRIQLSPTRDHIKMAELSGSMSMSSNFENEEGLEKNSAIGQYPAPDSRNNKVCKGEKSSIDKDKELVCVQLSRPTSSQVEYKECSKTDYRMKSCLSSDHENNSRLFDKKRLPKRDHKGSVIFKKEQNLDSYMNLETPSCMSRDVIRNMELITEDKREESINDVNLSYSHEMNASNKSKFI